MNCHAARDAMLIADLNDLRASSSPLGAHLETCGRCRTLADGIARDTMAMGAMLPHRSVETRRRMTPRVALLVSLPIAAAIVGAIALNGVRRPELVVPSPSAKSVAREVSLTVAPGQHAAVIKTPDPTVTVIWLNQGGGE